MQNPLITVSQLAALRQQQDITLLDVRFGGPGSSGGQEHYLEGHIPGAVLVDMDTALASPSIGPGGRHPLPHPEAFEAAMRAAGVSNDRPVVVYDNWRSIAAARAWWLLQHHGHGDTFVLDGGLGAWQSAGLPVEQGNISPAPGDFRLGNNPSSAVLDADEAAGLASTGMLLDARPGDRFRGVGETVDPVAGHIPGARSLPAFELADEHGFLLPASELREKFEAVGAGEGIVGVYCGSGIQAAHVALASVVAGLPLPALYPGSWSDWITDPTRPVATGQ
ncbi:sulfurtransferase [Arachnia propionica]|uniref:sulfurtransferase n=1 Tax=Arachnia propionica TaxID=1750 RepID=UPI0030CB0FF5